MLCRLNILVVCCFLSIQALFAIEQEDRFAIQTIIQDYIIAWNEQEGRGFANDFSEDADFVNVVGMCFSGREEIEQRHIKILQSFLKGSQFELVNLKLREVQVGLIIALVHWRLEGYRNLTSDENEPTETREGIFTHVFVQFDKTWKIVASQNTLIPKRVSSNS
jgi:uncharacterized protein (TIGR02246 family)